MRLRINWTVLGLALLIYIYLGLFQELTILLISGKSVMPALAPRNLMLNLTGALPFIGFSVVLYYLLVRYYRKVSTPWLLALLVCGVSCMIGLRYLLEEVLLRYFTGSGNYREGTSLIYYYLDNTYYAILYGSVGVVYFFIQFAFKAEKEKSQLELENKATQLQFLRSQINPHFLFNSLNNIYSLVHRKSDKALPSVDKLSKLLRYSLYEMGSSTTVAKEVEQIYHLMELEQLRRERAIQVKTNFDMRAEHVQIPPYLLLPFIENAYKHGDLHNDDYPITVVLKLEGEQLIYSVENAIQEKQKDKVGGIGLLNIQKRLGLLYDDRYTLDIEKGERFFKAHLDIPIQQAVSK